MIMNMKDAVRVELHKLAYVPKSHIDLKVVVDRVRLLINVYIKDSDVHIIEKQITYNLKKKGMYIASIKVLEDGAVHKKTVIMNTI
jgi:hypothetical protein